MSYLEEMARLGLTVNWCTLLLGLEGPGKCPPTLSVEDVKLFAADRVLSPVGDDAVAVLIASEEGREALQTLLRQLAGSAGSDAKRELRKWRLVLLDRALAELSPEPLYALVGMTEFWEQFDYPSDSPHVVQARGNDAQPAQYYSAENARLELEHHRAWRDAEWRALRESEPGGAA